MPADCVVTGLHSNLINVKFDAVVSGINFGANMGTDIIYSGTCAAARQGILYGVPSIALSIDPIDWKKASEEGFKFSALADFAAKNLEKLISICKTDYPRMFVNVNAASLDEYKGVKFAETLCDREYNDILEVSGDEKLTARFKSGATETVKDSRSDYYICRDGYIAVSLVYAEPVAGKCVDGIDFSL